MKAMLYILTTVTALCHAQSNKDFNFVFKYGVGAKNVLDTRKGIFIKDMVSGPSLEIKLQLTEQEKQTIYSKLKELNFETLSPVNVYQPKDTGSIWRMTPCESFSMKAKLKKREKEVRWDNCTGGPESKDGIHEKLLELSKLIVSMIESKEEYKKSPKPRSAYI